MPSVATNDATVILPVVTEQKTKLISKNTLKFTCLGCFSLWSMSWIKKYFISVMPRIQI